jgi:hypothetical protein
MAQRSHAGRQLQAQLGRACPAGAARTEVRAQGNQVVGRRNRPGKRREVAGVAGAVGTIVAAGRLRRAARPSLSARLTVLQRRFSLGCGMYGLVREQAGWVVGNRM